MSEHDEQVALFRWARMREDLYPELEMLYAVPNGGHRHKAVAAKLKAEGVKAGVLDVNLDIARGPYHGLRGEMKYGKNTTTPMQDNWIYRYEKWGYKTGVWYSWLEAARAICDYLGIYDEDLQ
jgi:hypothetical protein